MSGDFRRGRCVVRRFCTDSVICLQSRFSSVYARRDSDVCKKHDEISQDTSIIFLSLHICNQVLGLTILLRDDTTLTRLSCNKP